MFRLGLIAFLGSGFVLGDCQGDDPLVSWRFQVDLGKDHGQQFGTLFEARDSTNRLVAGAGFMEAYNTRFRSDRHTLQFFVRPDHDADKFTITQLPHPDLGTGAYLFDVDQQLYAWSSIQKDSVRLWDPALQSWKKTNNKTRYRSGDGMIRLGNGRLSFVGNRATYQDRTILSPPKDGRYYSFYYARGHLFFFHTSVSKRETRIYACPWTPESDHPIELENADFMITKYAGETPFAYGQFGDEVLSVSNQGGIYVWDISGWRTLLEADNQVSYQVYSMLNYYDRLLLAQYPTGNLFEYKDRQIKRLINVPPRIQGVSAHAREAQTMAIYRGELFVGVWPWAELWRLRDSNGSWQSMGRAFSHPDLTNKQVHPYEKESKKFSLVLNHWGQRITGMIPLSDSLMMSTSSKGTGLWNSKFDFLSEAQRREYGAVLKFHLSGNLAVSIQWQDRPIRLDFEVFDDRIVVRQDGKTLGSAVITKHAAQNSVSAILSCGKGVFGPFHGVSLTQR